MSLTKIQELSCHLPDKEISKLIRLAATNIQNPGTLSGNKRKQFTWIGEEKLSRIESIIEESFAQYIEATRSEDVVIERDRSLGDGC